MPFFVKMSLAAGATNHHSLSLKNEKDLFIHTFGSGTSLQVPYWSSSSEGMQARTVLFSVYA
jgi:hypothetical protein